MDFPGIKPNEKMIKIVFLYFPAITNKKLPEQLISGSFNCFSLFVF